MNFKKIIKEKGLKFKWVAEQVGITATEISFYLNGDRAMPDEVKEKLKLLLM